MNMAQQPGPVAKAAAVKSFEELQKADFGTKASLASAAAWSPNPKNPPLFIDLPWKDGQFQPMVAARWVANSPIALADQYIPELKTLRSIAFDSGDKDAAIAASVRTLDQVLTNYGIPHDFEIYPGDHTSNVPARIETKMMPFFSKNLAFERVRK
jgi:hypothetical protein